MSASAIPVNCFKISVFHRHLLSPKTTSFPALALKLSVCLKHLPCRGTKNAYQLVLIYRVLDFRCESPPAMFVHKNARTVPSLAVEELRPSVASVGKPQIALHLNKFNARGLQALSRKFFIVFQCILSHIVVEIYGSCRQFFIFRSLCKERDA